MSKESLLYRPERTIAEIMRVLLPVGRRRAALTVDCLLEITRIGAAEATLRTEIKALFDATAAESEGKHSFTDHYKVKIVSVVD